MESAIKAKLLDQHQLILTAINGCLDPSHSGHILYAYLFVHPTLTSEVDVKASLYNLLDCIIHTVSCT